MKPGPMLITVQITLVTVTVVVIVRSVCSRLPVSEDFQFMEVPFSTKKTINVAQVLCTCFCQRLSQNKF